MKFVDAERVHQLLPFPMLVDALEEAHRGPEPITERSLLVDADASTGQCFLNLPAWQPGRAFVTDPKNAVVLRFGEKVVVISPERPDEFVAALDVRVAPRE